MRIAAATDSGIRRFPLVSPRGEGARFGFVFFTQPRPIGTLLCKICMLAHVYEALLVAAPRNNLQFGHASVKCILQTAHGVLFIYVWLLAALQPQIESRLRNKWIATQMEERCNIPRCGTLGVMLKGNAQP